MDVGLDLAGLWSWTVPLWGLFVLVLFLGGIMTAPITLSPMEGPQAGGGGSGSGSRKKYRQ
jgi:hypothetical protein